MTYNVFSGTLNPTHSLTHYSLCNSINTFKTHTSVLPEPKMNKKWLSR